jgi:predicted Fe-Mo cluster-binding NifX family protein
MPDKTASSSGEVKDGSVYIYEAEEEKAIQTLKHELVDYLITSRIVKPVVNLLNILIKAREAEIYKEKEKLVEIFSKII